MRATPTYIDLDLKIEPSPAGDGALQIRVQDSPWGPTPASAYRLPIEAEEARKILASLQASIWCRGASGGSSSRHADVLETEQELESFRPAVLGEALFGALFEGERRDRLLNSLATIEATPIHGLRIRLILDPAIAEEVSVWPWELLFRRETRDYLARNVRTPFVRQIEVPRLTLAPDPISELRVLVVLSDPSDERRLDVHGEESLISEMLSAEPGVRLSLLENPTLDTLRQRMRDEPIDVVHFIGHGGWTDSGEGALYFEDSEGRARRVGATVVAEALKVGHQARLVVLNACETGRLSRTPTGRDPFLGTASALIMSGIPAVVAHQFEISDPAALAFSKAFYSYLAAGDPIEAAVAEGRQRILYHRESTWEWCTPVLYLSVNHGQLFDLTPQRPAETETPTGASEKSTEAALEAAVDLYETGQYERALDAMLQVQESAPADPALVYFVGLARLCGQRPRAARLDVIKTIEAELDHASQLCGGRDPAHFWFLRALIKYDFYRFKGMRIQPLSVEELLEEARSASLDQREIRRLLNHVPTPAGIVREALEEILSRRSVG